MCDKLTMTLSMTNENDSLTFCIHSSDTSYLQIPDSSQFRYVFFPSWLEQRMRWQPKEQNK